MPFYEYECSHCRFYTEVMQKITDKPLKKCPSCGKSTFKKLISAPVFRLKGSGWYETDFKTDKDNKRNLAGGDKEDASAKSDSKAESSPASGAAAAADSKSETKSESKPDAKSDSKSDAKAAGKGGGKAESGASAAPAKPPAVTTRTIAGRASHAKSATARRAHPAKRKASKRRGGR
jgi:putative FmdB family regulatory protein